MPADDRAAADARLDQALRTTGAADPRAPLRETLRALRLEDAAAFEEALRRFDEVLVPRVAAGEVDPLTEWVEYGRFLAELRGPGSVTAVAPDGRAQSWAPPYRAGSLVLHLPQDNRRRALVLAAPAEPSPAQQATVELLT
jgi:hypothetical protein